jgi:Chaperone of endosialidase
MNPLIQPKNASPLILIALLLASLPLSPGARAVVPAPDGGYPGQNTAEGQSALLHLAGGTYNTALGWASLGFNVTGNYNTGVGAATLLNNTASENTATGAGALLSNTDGHSNTANGAFALFGNTAGDFNTATGGQALYSNTTGFENTADGYQALFSNTTGDGNTANGNFALHDNTTGQGNVASGLGALSNNTTGRFNIAVGYGSGANMTTADNVISIGSPGDSAAFTTSNRCFIGNIRGVIVGNSDGQLGTSNSSRRFKKDIKPMEQTSETILALKPVTFHYKNQDTKKAENTSQFGLIAEDVAEVNPDLVVRGADGEPLSVRYDAVNAMLLNEFLKEHRAFVEERRKVEKLEATVASLWQ